VILHLEVLFLPFLACLILTGIHVYLGIHVISRKVIFVDIALAQIAALGGTVAFLLGYDPRSEGAYFCSLAFAVLAAMVFALTRTRHERVPQEAVIGLAYATASAAAILLADISPHGAEHLHDLLAGSIVWVTPAQILKTGILYSLLGVFHFVFRKRFLQISLHPEQAYAEGMRVRLWDFLFYLSFGVVITSSVQIAGVLLVFCYLVAPSIFAVMFFEDLRARLITGWVMGTLVSAIGLSFSYDRPSGPTIMVAFALALLVGALVRSVLRGARPAVALAATAAVVLVLTAGAASLQSSHTTAAEPEGAAEAAEAAAARAGHESSAPETGAAHEQGEGIEGLRRALRDAHAEVRSRAVADLARSGDPRIVHDLVDALADQDAGVREAAAAALGQLGSRTAVAPLLQHLGHPDEDAWVRLRMAQSLGSLGEPVSLAALADLASGGEGKLLRLEAVQSLSRLVGLGDTGLDDPDSEVARQRVARARAIIKSRGGKPRFDPQSRTFSDR
jgi:zinc/manganese transport system permease protein